MTTNECAREITATMYSDSLITLDEQKVACLLHGKVMTSEEISDFCLGDDEGTISARLTDMFPELHEYIESFF